MSNHQIKINRANALAPTLPMATREIMDSISDMLIERLTATELAEVKRCLDRHWHKAVSHATDNGRVEVTNDCLWINDRLIPLAAIKAIKVDESAEIEPGDPNHYNSNFRGPQRWSITTYTLDYMERF